MPASPDVIILCGGTGTRLRSVTGETPKSMAAIAGRPFLGLLLRQLKRHQFERAILAVGYRKDAIMGEFGSMAFGLTLEYSVEECPLGTGGALCKASELVQSADVLVMNGDSYTDAALGTFVASHFQSKAEVSLVASPADGRADCGALVADEHNRLLRFDEKTMTEGSRYLNAGIYLIARTLLAGMGSGVAISLEKECFPRWLSEGKDIRVFADSAPCIDIGTPERYREAQNALASQ